jgi:hypothetical protein
MASAVAACWAIGRPSATIAAGTVFDRSRYLNSAQQILQEQQGLGTRFRHFRHAGDCVRRRLVCQRPPGHAAWLAAPPVWALRAVCGVSIVFLGVASAAS